VLVTVTIPAPTVVTPTVVELSTITSGVKELKSRYLLKLSDKSVTPL